MENSTPFDLDQALSQWRASLQNLGGMHPDELEELECHLRESISVLHARGLSIPEAFAVATRRLGSDRQLSAEFAKANPQRTWTERAMWMVAGVLAAYTLSAVSAPATNIVLNCAIWSGLKGHWVGALHLLAGWLSWAGAAAITYWCFGRHSSWLGHTARACMRQPVLTGLSLFIGLECLPYGMRYVNRFAEPVYSFFNGHHVAPNPNIGVDLSWWFLYGSLLTRVLWIAAVPLLAGYAWRKRWSLVSNSESSSGLDAGEDDATRSLQGQGLSLQEASLVLAQRRSPQQDVNLSLSPATDRGIWLERTVWMVAGVALDRCLEMFVLNVGWLPLMVTHPATPLYQHLTGFASACLSLMLGGALIAVLWWWVTRHARQIGLIGNLCRRRPLLSAIALVLICAGVGVSEYGMFIYVLPREVLRGPSSIGPIATQWFTYSGALTHLIIPIALLLWLARRWRSIQPNPALGR